MKSALQHSQVRSERVFGDRVRRGAPSGSIGPNTVENSDNQQFWNNPKGEYREMESNSRPEGESVNDAIDPELCSLSYCGVEDAAKEITRQGRNAVMASRVPTMWYLFTRTTAGCWE